jgi:hypothetical protein
MKACKIRQIYYSDFYAWFYDMKRVAYMTSGDFFDGVSRDGILFFLTKKNLNFENFFVYNSGFK